MEDDLLQGVGALCRRFEEAQPALTHDAGIGKAVAAGFGGGEESVPAVHLKADDGAAAQGCHFAPFQGTVEVECQLACLLAEAEVERQDVSQRVYHQPQPANLASCEDIEDLGGVAHLAVCSAHGVIIMENGGRI